MKKLRYNKSWYAAALIAVGMSSCTKQLDEYNPGGATADAVWSTPSGFVTAVNAAYWAQRYWYGKEDGLFMTEMGTDIWTNSGNNPTFAKELSKYNGLSGTQGYINNTWKYLWVGINQCNAGINRIDGVGFTNEAEKNKRLGELRFLRGFYYWHIVETWGNVMLRTKETTEFENTAERSTIKDLYDLIFSDLEFAKDNLPMDWGAAEYSRASKKSAIGMLARAYLSRGYYPDADATACFTKARDYAKEITSKLTTYNVSLYGAPADLWNPANNKKNKESLYTISNSSVSTSYNFDAQGNKLHQLFIANYPSHPGMKVSKDYGRYGALAMPTRYLLNLFGAGDKRYDAYFQEKWLNNNGKFTWTPSNYTKYGSTNNKDSLAMVTGGPGNMVIDTNTLALWISRTPIPNKRTVNYCAFDLDDLYNANGTVKDNIGNFPSFKKYMDPLRSVDVTSQTGTNDILVIRLAEMYAIAGEAEYKLGNAGEAATQFNFIRGRAGAPAVAAGDINPTWILEERAREFCGESIRWFDLRRILRGDEWANYIKDRNPDITQIKATYWLRPISQTELNGLLNAADFGNNGY